ncbi:MAG: zinc ribbon domain-containing protein [Chloroflexota bacterium]|nr:zinc ribbon domain-containing protein [Dehalococcoidia bacterium]MDW8254296.1 zinc ribbon domain-containing protein [Chloroflexota bacterium]
MPIYEYRCVEERKLFQVRRPMSQLDEPTACPDCGAPAKRVLSLFATIARGDGASSAEESLAAPGGGCCGGACGCGASLN